MTVFLKVVTIQRIDLTRTLHVCFTLGNLVSVF